MGYKEYLQSEHWKGFRKKILEKRFRCQRCTRKDVILNLHHKNYKCLGKERGKDIIVLCQECHNLMHKKKKWIKAYKNGEDLDFTGASARALRIMRGQKSPVSRKCRRCNGIHKLFYMIRVDGKKVLYTLCPNSKPRTEFLPFEEIDNIPIIRDYRESQRHLRKLEKRTLKKLSKRLAVDNTVITSK